MDDKRVMRYSRHIMLPEIDPEGQRLNVAAGATEPRNG